MRVNVLAKKNGGLLGCTCEVRADAEKAWSSLDAKGESLLECGVKTTGDRTAPQLSGLLLHTHPTAQ